MKNSNSLTHYTLFQILSEKVSQSDALIKFISASTFKINFLKLFFKFVVFEASDEAILLKRELWLHKLKVEMVVLIERLLVDPRQIRP